MSDITPHLLLPYILASQAQKHVTHNEALRLLDAMVQLAVLDRDLTAPPASPTDGDRYIVASGATGLWAGWDLNIAFWVDGVWLRLVPKPGWTTWVADEAVTVLWSGSSWIGLLGVGDLQNLGGVGINTTSDATNKLAVASAATLLNHAGAGHQLKINKAAVGDTASLLYQTGFSGRAEMGLAGSDGFSIKVSADGSAWNTGLSLTAATGTVNMPLGAVVTGTITGTAITQSATDTTAGRLMKVGDGGWLTLNPTTVTLATATTPGAYRYSGSATDPSAPSASGGAVLVMRHGSSTYIIQQAHSATSWARYARTSSDNGATWSDWRLDYNRSNVVGAVSQSAGVPTGAVIERGSNANGSYTRFADGTQICTRKTSASLAIDQAFLGGFRAAVQLWTYPAAFIAAPTIKVTPENLTAFGSGINSIGLATSQWTVTAITSQTAATRDVSLLAIGTWF